MAAQLHAGNAAFVDEEYDRGTIVAQWPVPVLAGDTPEVLAARVLTVEHQLYPRVADHLCRALVEGREPGPFAVSGDAFTTVATGADTALAMGIEETLTP